jgi:FkbM family methyltransferase
MRYKIIQNVFNKLIRPYIYFKTNTFYKKIISKNDLCFDIGANIGNRTAIFLRLGGKVVAVEPQKDCLQFIKERFVKNKNLIIEQAALSDKVEELEFYIANKNECSTFSTELIKRFGKEGFLKWNKKEIIKTTTLDILIEKYGLPQFCKIDVEGFELKVLNGLSKRISVIAFEFNHPFLKDAIDCVLLLSGKGYLLFNYIAFEKFEFKCEQWVNAEQIIEMLKSMTPEIATGEIFAK